jgi:hypothetical protein
MAFKELAMFQFSADLLSGLRRRLHSSSSARLGQRRGSHSALLEVTLLEDRCVLAPIYVGTNVYQVTTVSDASKVLFMGGTAKGQNWGTMPQKELTLFNNSSDKQTIFPFLYSPNNNRLYDPIDDPKEEYRIYVGYKDGAKNSLGLPYGRSITLNVPLVFWNGGRACIATDGANLIPKPENVGTLNPFNFYYSKNGRNAAIYIGNQGVLKSTGNNGILMYYHSDDKGEPNDPNPAALGQLTEWTIRDKDFLTKVNAYTKKNNIGTIPNSELTTLINYDVSYVDDLLAPIAMEATQVPVPISYIQAGKATTSFANGKTTTKIQLQKDATQAFLLQLLTTQPTQPAARLRRARTALKVDWQVVFNKSLTETLELGTVTNVDKNTGTVTLVKTGTVAGLPASSAPFVFSTNDVKRDFGWTGAKNSISDLQKVVAAFTSNDASQSGLGKYFGGKGWPQYYNPVSSLRKIPGGANILVNSPLTDTRSPYGQNFNLLTSNGAYRIEYGANGVLDPKAQNTNSGSTVTFKLTLSRDFTSADLEAMRKVLVDQKVAWNVSFSQNLIGTITEIDTQTQIIKVKLSQTIANLPSGYSLAFKTPVLDPYSTRLRDLWYSWAKYYVNLPKFNGLAPQPIAAKVSADKDSNADTRILDFAKAQPQLALGMKVSGQGIAGLITIIRISPDMKRVYLSAPVPQGLSGKTVQFTFSKPDLIPTYGDPVNADLINANAFGQDKAFADLFAASVYETMAVYSTIQKPTVPKLPRSMGLVYECIGGGVGHLPTAAFVEISADARDLGKSVLRGVPDFNKYPNTNTNDANWKPGAWYPPPSRTGYGVDYNVFNLDPYVWFVHQRLGLSGYGFSFDDDASDIGASGTSTLSLAYAGLDGIPNRTEWFASTQWGVVNTTNARIAQYSGPDKTLLGSTIVSLDKSWQGITVYNQVRPDDPDNAVIGAYLEGTGIVDKTRLKRLLSSTDLTMVISQKPSKQLPYTTDLTFAGTPDLANNVFALRQGA